MDVPRPYLLAFPYGHPNETQRATRAWLVERTAQLRPDFPPGGAVPGYGGAVPAFVTTQELLERVVAVPLRTNAVHPEAAKQMADCCFLFSALVFPFEADVEPRLTDFQMRLHLAAKAAGIPSYLWRLWSDRFVALIGAKADRPFTDSHPFLALTEGEEPTPGG